MRYSVGDLKSSELSEKEGEKKGHYRMTRSAPVTTASRRYSQAQTRRNRECEKATKAKSTGILVTSMAPSEKMLISI